MREHRNPTTQGVEARGRERLMAAIHSHPGLDDGGAGIVIGPGEGYRHNGNGTLLADPASQAIAAHTTPGRKPSDLEPLSGEPALGELRRREFLRRRPRYSSSPGVDAARAKQSRNDLTVALLRAMVPDEVADQSEFPPIRELVADIRRRIVELDPACCPACFHERSADKAHDPEGEPLHGKYEIACEHCEHREIVKRSADNDD